VPRQGTLTQWRISHLTYVQLFLWFIFEIDLKHQRKILESLFRVRGLGFSLASFSLRYCSNIKLLFLGKTSVDVYELCVKVVELSTDGGADMVDKVTFS